jgi:hypothetical protein
MSGLGWVGADLQRSTETGCGAVSALSTACSSYTLMSVVGRGGGSWRSAQSHRSSLGQDEVRRRSGTAQLFCFGASGAGSGSMDMWEAASDGERWVRMRLYCSLRPRLRYSYYYMPCAM